MEIESVSSGRGLRLFAKHALPLLNPRDPRLESVKAYNQKLGFLAGVPSMAPAHAVAPDKTRERAIREFRSTLLRLTDQWIESGRSGGIEEPWARSVRYTSPNHSQSIQSTLTKFWQRNPPEMGFRGDQPILEIQTALYEPTWAQLASEPIGRLEGRARDHALTHFVSLMDSPSRYQLFRCETCHSYFVKKRMPRKGVVIKTGSHCEDCKNTASKRRVYIQRETRHKAMIGWAADVWDQWREDRRQGVLATWIARQVNKRLPVGWRRIDQTKTNWFTRNQEEIEAEVERRKHATRKS